MRSLLVAVAAVVLLCSAADAQMQCEGRLIENGATLSEVLELCGEPTGRVRSERLLSAGLLDSPASEQVRIPVETWTYDQPGQFSRKLIFESGKLVIASKKIVPTDRAYFFVCPKPYCTLAKVEAFRSWLVKQAKAAPRPRSLMPAAV